jgi:hypothetical protein
VGPQIKRFLVWLWENVFDENSTSAFGAVMVSMAICLFFVGVAALLANSGPESPEHQRLINQSYKNYEPDVETRKSRLRAMASSFPGRSSTIDCLINHTYEIHEPDKSVRDLADQLLAEQRKVKQ